MVMYVAASALAEQTLDTGHPLDLTKAEVIDHHPHTMMQCLLESWHIQSNQDTLTREKGTLPELYKVYKSKSALFVWKL